MQTLISRGRVAGTFTGALLFLTAPALAQQPTSTVVDGGRRALAVAAAEDGVVAKVCAKADGCDATGGQKLRPPPSFRGKASAAAIQPITLSNGKKIVWVSFQGDEGRGFQLLLAPPQAGEEPRVVYSGVTGGPAGAERVTSFSVDQDPSGKATVRLATTARLCDKDVLVSSRTLDAGRLELVGTAGPDPLGARRAGAVKVAATRSALDGAGDKAFRILRPRAASSGASSLAVDGDEKTAWVEEEAGAGRHAFASFASSGGVGVTGLDLVLLPPPGVDAPRAPKTVAVAVDSGVYTLELTEPPGATGSRYVATFPAPVKTTCLAFVIDEVHPAGGGGKKGDPAAYVSEIRARTQLDGKAIEDLARGLAGGGPAARDNLAVLEAEGKRGLAAAIAVYDELDGAGRDLARRLIDAAPCADKLPLYIPLLVGKDKDEAERARDRIRRCGKDAGAPLLAKLESAKPEELGVLAEEAAFVAPDAAVPFVLKALDAAPDSAGRRPLRRALAKAAARETGIRALGRAASDPGFAKLSLAARVDFLRALGDDAPRVEGADKAFASTQTDATSFRDRYLLLAPAAALARAGNKSAEGALASALGDAKQPRLRARAAELSAGVAGLRPKLLVLVDDEEVRVREAALASVAQKGTLDQAVTVRLLVRLVKDPWTFVRRAAAAGLAGAPAGATTDAAIGGAVDFEPSPIVRAEMVKTLGLRKATTATGVVAERAFDDKEAVDVRVQAIEALGRICARDQLGAISELAMRGQAPVFEADRKLAIAAITALGHLRPADLGSRLAPLGAKNAPAEIREVTRLVLADKARTCTK
jgi:hypothetical protein